MNYELSEHARDVLTEREIPIEWLERALFSARLIQPHGTDTESNIGSP